MPHSFGLVPHRSKELRKLLLAYYSVLIPSMFNLFLLVPPLSDLVCTLVTLMAYFIYLSLVSFS